MAFSCSVRSVQSISAAAGVSGLSASVSRSSPNSAVLTTVAGSGGTRTISVNIDPDGYYLLRIWLVDSATAPGSQTLAPPSGGATVEWYEVTDATGALTKTITHNSTGTWYLCVAMIDVVHVSEAITFS